MEKKLARKAALAERARLANAQIKDLSERIAQNFLAEFSEYSSYMLYHSFMSEVHTHQLIDKLFLMKKTVCLPRVSGDNLKVGVYRGPDSLSPGAFGIQEPVECADFKHIDIAVVPGAAFDRSFHRIGYGKGYYDRLLGAVHFGVTVGFAFECQIIHRFDHEPHDIPVDVLVTEKDIYRRNS